VDSTKAWLDHLWRNVINGWDDLWSIFTGNFQGTYVHPGHPWDLMGYRQKPGKSLGDYIWCFSQNCHKLRSLAAAIVMSAFWEGMTCRTLVHKLGRKQPRTTIELLNITT
jgi:hypothetical protein